MNRTKPSTGYREIHHTADIAIQVWADNLPNLFTEAARGMYAIMGVASEKKPGKGKTITFHAEDDVSLLVAFLNELLFEAEHHRTAFMDILVNISNGRLVATLNEGIVCKINREIKAVTYHHLNVVESQQGVEATIVFDV